MHDRVEALVRKYHPELEKAKVRVDLLFVADPDAADKEAPKPVLSHHGVPAIAMARIVPLKDRVKGSGDGEILIDMARYEEMDPAERDALLDHEMEHFEVKTKEMKPKLDTHGRPTLKIRKHDYDFGWFESVAKRHKENSVEVGQAHRLWTMRQTFFAFVDG